MPITRHGYSNQRAERRKQYDSPEHRHLRNRYAAHIAAGHIECARCHQPIHPNEPWDLDHTPDRTTYLGPSHPTCNRSGRPPGGGVPSKTTPPPHSRGIL